MKQIQGQIRHEGLETPEVYLPEDFLRGLSDDVNYVATAQGSTLIFPDDSGTEISLVDRDLETTEWPTGTAKAFLTDGDRRVAIDVRSL